MRNSAAMIYLKGIHLTSVIGIAILKIIFMEYVQRDMGILYYGMITKTKMNASRTIA